MKRPKRMVAMLLAASLTIGEFFSGGLGITALAAEYDAGEGSYLEEKVDEVFLNGESMEEMPEILGASYTFSKGTLTLKGNVNSTEIQNYAKKDQVKKIVAAKGTVLPQDCSDLFARYEVCEQIDLSKADTSKVTNMKQMFENCYKLASLNISSFNTSKVTDMTKMFSGCRTLEQLDVSSFDTKNVTSMQQMFFGCHSFIKLDLRNFNTSKVTNMDSMFAQCHNIEYIDVSSFDTSSVTNMYFMFGYDMQLKELDLSHFDTSNVTNMKMMFFSLNSCSALDLSSFNTRNVTDMQQMFAFSKGLKSLDLGGKGFDTENVGKTDKMFVGLENLETLTLGKNFEIVSFEMELDNGEGLGWSKEDGKEDISGRGGIAQIFNNGRNTYHKRKMIQGNMTIEGVAIYGRKLYAKVTDCNVNDLEYQWMRNDSPLLKENETSFFLRTMDVYNVISCEVTSKTPWIVGSLKATMSQRIDKEAGPAAPEGLEGVPPTTKGGSDGKIIGGYGTLEYATKKDFSDKKTCDCTKGSITDLKAGTYYVRYGESPGTHAGEYAIVVVADGKDALSGKVAIKGTLKCGQTLTAKVSDSNASKFTYQWKRGSSAIKGATTSTYKLVKADIGQVISCVVTDATGSTKGSISAKTSAKIEKADDPADDKKDVTKIFKDVKAGEWYVNAIQFVFDRKIMNGVSDSQFGTQAVITREQFVTVLYNMENQPSVKYRKIFTDVPDKQYYSKAVIWAFDNKITSGISTTLFGTDNTISREQLATMIYNYAQYKKLKSTGKSKDLSTFPDYTKVSNWAKEGMIWAVSNGIVNGKASNGKNYLDPAGKATRAECAQMIKNLFDNVIKK